MRLNRIHALTLAVGALMLSNSFIFQSNAQNPFEAIQRFGNIGVGQHIQELDASNDAPIIFDTHTKTLSSSSPLVEIRTQINDDNGVKDAHVFYSFDGWTTTKQKRLSKTGNNFFAHILLEGDTLGYYIQASDVLGTTSRFPTNLAVQESPKGVLHAASAVPQARSEEIYYHNRPHTQAYTPLRDSRHAYYINRFEFLNLILEPLGFTNQDGVTDTSLDLAVSLGLMDLWPGRYEPLSYVGRDDGVLLMLRARQIKDQLEYLPFDSFLNTLVPEASDELSDVLSTTTLAKFESTLWSNQSGQYVKKVREAFNLLGYDAGMGETYDTYLRTAITQFQLDHELIQDLSEIRAGRFDNSTRDKLNNVLLSEGPIITIDIERPHTLLRYEDALKLAERILDI